MTLIKDLKKAYEHAVANKQETFTLDGYEFYTPYAKYLLEYLLKHKKLKLTSKIRFETMRACENCEKCDGGCEKI